MPRFTLCRGACALFLSAALLVPTAASAATKAPSGVSGWWQFLVRLVAAEGCIIDPHGACAPSPSGTAPEGCILDPHGRCLQSSSSTVPEGCGLDPHGLCTPAPHTANVDEGCMLDPHGLCSPSH
jgi:hypothetical protein